MPIRVGSLHCQKGWYREIEGKVVTITHLEKHPADHDKHDEDHTLIYVHCADDLGSYGDHSPPEAVSHLADESGLLLSWYVFLEDVLPLDNEGYIKALPSW